MTLEQWYDKYRIPYEKVGPCVGLPDNEIYGPRRIELYELTDYVVGSVIDGTIWLARRHE